jgi:cytoskeletal protein RodZ
VAKNNDTDSNRTLGLGWWVSGGLLVVLIVGIIVGVVLWPRDTTAAPQNTTTPTTTEQATTSAPAQAGTACTASNANQEVPTETPDTVWKTHPDQMLVPTSEKYGPNTQDGNLWSCFERSPTGAVFAGPNLLTAISMGEADAAIPGPGRDELLEASASASSDFERPVIEGFRVLAADKNTATIDYWVTASGQNVSMGLDLVWDEKSADWRLNLETPGDHPRYGTLEDTAPYVRWR